MNEGERPTFGTCKLMGGVQAAQGIDNEAEGDPARDRNSASEGAAGEGGDGVPLDVGHHQIKRFWLVAAFEDFDDVAVFDSRRDRSLAEEIPGRPRDSRAAGLFAEVPVEDFDGDEPVEADVRRIACKIHGCHAAGPERRDHVVAPNPRGGVTDAAPLVGERPAGGR